MQYLSSITARHGQEIPASLALQPGQWVRQGSGGLIHRKGVYMGTVNSSGEDVVVWDLGQPRPEFRHLMMVSRAFVVESNRQGKTRQGLWEGLVKLFS